MIVFVWITKAFERLIFSTEAMCRAHYRTNDLTLAVNISSEFTTSSGSRIWSRGGAKNFFRDFADVAKRSRASKANNIFQEFDKFVLFLVCRYINL